MFTCKTRNNCIIIDLSSAPPSPLEGFIFCFVLGKYGDTTLERIEANNTISDGEGEGKKDSVEMYIALRNGTIESDHLCVMYDHRCSAFLNSRAKNKKRVQNRGYNGVTIFIQRNFYTAAADV